MFKRIRSKSSAAPAMFEKLESRELFAATPIATTTTITPSATSFVMGQTVDLTVQVKAATGKNAPRGRVALYTSGLATTFVSTLSSKGVAHIILGPGYALAPNNYSFTVRYRPSTGFGSSVSKKFNFTVVFPAAKKFHQHSNGLDVDTITAGTGATVAKGDKITFEATSYDTNGNLLSENATHTPNTSQITVGQNQIFSGFDLGVAGMAVGEVRLMEIPPALAFNDGRTIVFVVHVISIDE